MLRFLLGSRASDPIYQWATEPWSVFSIAEYFLAQKLKQYAEFYIYNEKLDQISAECVITPLRTPLGEIVCKMTYIIMCPVGR